MLIVAFSGTLLADQTLFYIGRYYGPGLLERKPQWRNRVDKIFNLLHRYNTGFILSFRFIYGIRILSPVVIGASGIAIKRFTILNFIAAIIWTLISCTGGYILGYLFGDMLEVFIEKALHYQKIFLIGIAGLVGIIYIVKKSGFFSKKQP